MVGKQKLVDVERRSSGTYLFGKEPKPQVISHCFVAN